MLKRIRERTARPAGKSHIRLWVVLALLIVTLPTVVYLIGVHGATELHVRVVREVREWDGTQPRPPDNVLIFEKTYHDIGLVCEAENELDSMPSSVMGGGLMGPFDYRYTFTFSTFGVVTQVYSGTDMDVTGSHTLFGRSVSQLPPSPWRLLYTLRGQLGIPTEGDWIP